MSNVLDGHTVLVFSADSNTIGADTALFQRLGARAVITAATINEANLVIAGGNVTVLVADVRSGGVDLIQQVKGTPTGARIALLDIANTSSEAFPARGKGSTALVRQDISDDGAADQIARAISRIGR